jgi:hypothetical protein
MKRVRLRRGAGTTVTESTQEAVRFSASVARHSTVVDPVENVDPELGVHAIATGA